MCFSFSHTHIFTQDSPYLLNYRAFKAQLLNCLSVALFALALPDLSDLIALIGAVASSALALIFPPLLHLMVSVQRQHLPWHSQYSSSMVKQVAWMTKDVLIMLLGIVGMGLGTYASINGLVGYFKDDSNSPNICVNFMQ